MDSKGGGECERGKQSVQSGRCPPLIRELLAGLKRLANTNSWATLYSDSQEPWKIFHGVVVGNGDDLRKTEALHSRGLANLPAAALGG